MGARAFAGILLAVTLTASAALAADPIDQLLTTPPDQIRAAIQQLPPEVQERIRQELQTKSLDQLMAMSPGDIEAAVHDLSPSAKAELKAEWASLSPEQKARLKSFDLKALWQEAVARFAAMGPTEKALVRKFLGEAAGLPSDAQP